MPQTSNETLRQMTIGCLIVLLSTPCTAPYLGTTIGFALAGSYWDIVIIMMSVALGLSVPYILCLCMPDIIEFIPKPGTWMKKLNLIMQLFLIITILWLISLLQAQTSFATGIRLIAYLAILLGVIWIKFATVNQLFLTQESADIKKYVLKLISRSAALLISCIVIVAVIDTKYHYNAHREQQESTQETKINFSTISQAIRQGKSVLVTVGADWCLTCSYNEALVFQNSGIRHLLDRYQIEMINVDWTDFNRETLDYMARYGRRGIPFYILYTPNIPEGMVLPEILSEKSLREIIKNTVQRP